MLVCYAVFTDSIQKKNMDAQQKQQIADRLNQSNNILVTVSTNPSVDQLAACIGLTLALNKMGKHAAAVFSGQVPSTIEFLQPEKTIEKTTDSLRDFIISLDKAKADKLRYKVEDKVVKIFITPYKTSISDKDLEFSQGDFNVDVVVALGVHAQTDIDQAITAHGRILHDAVVSTINVAPGGELGTINWLDPAASSLSELVMRLLKTMNKHVLDGQMATSFLTGIVAETKRFSNNRTSPQTMTISAELMAAGANQQLVATKLEPPKPKEEPKPEPAKPPAKPLEAASAPVADMPKPIGPLAQATEKSTEGTLEIEHVEPSTKHVGSIPSLEQNEPTTPQIDIDREGTLRRLEELQASKSPTNSNLTEDTKGRKILQPLGAGEPTMTGALSQPAAAPANDGLSLPQPNYADPDIERPSGAPPLPAADAFSPSPYSPPSVASALPTSPAPQFTSQPVSTPPATPPSDVGAAFSPPPMPATDFSAAPASPVPTIDPNHITNARDAVHQAIGSQPIGSGPLPPVAALNALPVNLDLRGQPSANLGGVGVGAPTNLPPVQTQGGSSIAPPPVPPPMMPPPSQ